MSRREFPGGIQARYAYLDKIDRRCEANGARCPNKAVVEWDGYSLTDAGERVAEYTGRKVCKKHKPLYFESSGWEIVTYRDVTGRHDDEGNLLPGEVNPWIARNERAAKRAADGEDITVSRPAVTVPATEMRFTG